MQFWEVLGESIVNITLIKALQNLYGNTAQVKIGNKLFHLLVLPKNYDRDFAFPLDFTYG